MGNLAKLKSRSNPFASSLITEWEDSFNKLKSSFENDLFLETFQPFLTRNSGFPPYNIKKVDGNIFEIEMALAGFTKSDIEVILDGNILTISSSKGEGDGETDKAAEFIYRGLGKRAFSSKFRLSDHTEVNECTMKDGILKIVVSENIPEDKQPKVIKIT